MQSTSLKAKRILVTGGTTGIGRATMTLLAREQAHVLIVGRHEGPLQDALADAPGDVRGVAADVATRDGVEEIFKCVDRDLGGIDMLVVCAALGAEPIHEMSDEDWRYAVETNLIGAMACARAALQRMLPTESGHLLFVGSISAHIKAPGESVYSATKAGLQAFTETLRKEVADRGIKVSLIEPGAVATDMQPLSSDEKQDAVAREEMLEAEEIGEAILFALSRSSRADLVSLRMEPLRQKLG